MASPKQQQRQVNTTSYLLQQFTRKRYDDTDLILREYYEGGTGCGRSEIAIRRLNTIHGMYEKEISNADMLFTLAQFVTAPAIWIDRSDESAILLAVARNRRERGNMRLLREHVVSCLEPCCPCAFL